MHKTIMVALTAASLLALSACKQATTGNAAENASSNAGAPAATGADAFNGTWKTDVSSIKMDTKPDQYLLKAGQFSCPTCTPPIAIAADGAFHPVSRPYADQMSVKVDDDHNVTRTNQKGGKTTYQQKFTVSPDGNTLTIAFNDTSGSKPVTGSFTESRAAPAPSGSHAISGSWKPEKLSNMSDEGLLITFNADSDMLHMSTPSGVGYDAKLDGTETPLKGDIGGTTVSVKKLADGSYQETDKRGGKVVDVVTMTVGPDGKLAFKDENKQNGSTTSSVANKQ
jgi:hypothetical protein